MTRNEAVSLIRDKILESRRIAITSHLRPDGDSICTGLALEGMFRRIGKQARVINHDPTPYPFCHMPEAGRIRIGQIPPRGYDLIILLECANVERSGMKNLGRIFKINIDHHYSNDHYADINWVEPEAAAVGEMAFLLGERMGIRWTPEIAGHLYCAVVSDTGSFQFSNTTARAFEVCHKLVKLGASPIKTTEFLFNTNSPEKIKLLAQVLSTLQINRQGHIATIAMFKKNLEALGLKEIDTEDIMTLARSIQGIEIVLFFKEMGRDKFRVSIRSKGKVNAAAIAELFDGGGHVHAAGFTAIGRHERLTKEIPRKIEAILKKERRFSRKEEHPSAPTD
ncbi:MAG: bifunctional oligoribonuclease/PAP phosphatase NrnA [Candidatus Aminicenantes bacterium]|nr:bifunctional oligoribonuclease/PAP phosphatase NrnA [Candidatus Aminicenantes bacterium]